MQSDFDTMMTPVVASLITDEHNVIAAAERRILGHLRTLAEQGNTVIVYPIGDTLGACPIRVYRPNDDRDGDAVCSTFLPENLATDLLDTDSNRPGAGNIGEA